MILCSKCRYGKPLSDSKKTYYECKFENYGVRAHNRCNNYKRKFNPIKSVKIFFRKVFKWR